MNNMKEKIAILLATYNGESYIVEQLDSLFEQSFKQWTLYVHDDGSTDKTCSILQKYAAAHSNMVILEYESQHGPKNNFLSLLKAIDADYYFFCDQDDRWCHDKIEKELIRIQAEEEKHPSIPILVFSDLYVVDRHLNIIESSMWKLSGIHPEYLTTFTECGAFTFVTGCTMLFNRKAKESTIFPADKATMHDSWIALCILKANGLVCPIYEPLVYYRQHGDNSLGASDWSQKSLLAKVGDLRYFIKRNYDQWRMLNALGYGSIFKYIYYKYRYKKLHHNL